ncbi:MAG: YIP1 family protein [Deltaproteobacteria bacterium]|nr:YIP1 family protein [Deltaproteobacteria bacterium]
MVVAKAIEESDLPPTIGFRFKRMLDPPRRLLGAIFVPDRTIPAEVEAGRYGAAILVVTALALTAALVIGDRLDMSADRSRRPGMSAAGERMSERELGEEAAKSRTVKQVTLGLAAGLGTPVSLFFLGVGILAVGRFVGGRPTFPRALAAAAHAALPSGVKSIIATAVALKTPRILPDAIDRLVVLPQLAPTRGLFLPRLLQGVDLFTLWSVLLLILGFSSATRIGRGKSALTVFFGFVLYLMVTRFLLGGTPPTGGPK